MRSRRRFERRRDELQSDGDDRRDELHPILIDIGRDDRRDSEVIRRLRELLDDQKCERTPFRCNDALKDLNFIVGVEGKQHGVTLDIRTSVRDPTVLGDRIQVQRALVNLVLNACDAASSTEVRQRGVDSREQSGPTPRRQTRQPFE